MLVLAAYVGTYIKYNKRRYKINERIQRENTACYSNKEIHRTNKVSRSTKTRIYKSSIRPVITYAAETMTMTRKEEEQFSI